MDLAFPQVSPSFIHEIPRILTPKSPFSAQNRVPDLKFRVDPDPPDDRHFTGRPEPQEPPDDRYLPDVRNPDPELKQRIFNPTGRPATGHPSISGRPLPVDIDFS